VRCRAFALGAGAELFYDTPPEIVRGEGNPAIVHAMAQQQAIVNVHDIFMKVSRRSPNDWPGSRAHRLHRFSNSGTYRITHRRIVV